MKLYRVETIDGYGAYNCDAVFCGEARETSPCPDFDDGLDWQGGWGEDWEDTLFAFDSEAAFRSWFNADEVQALSAAGCYLSVYECEVYKLGDYQACFDPARAVLVEQKILLEVHNV